LAVAKRRFGSKTASPVNGWRGGYAPDNGHEGERPARQRWANNCLTHRNKDSLPFRRRAAVKSVTDLPIGS
jgi:hypothetical protein